VQAIPTAPELAPPPDVCKFCDDQGILDYLRLALRLAAQTFELNGDPRLTLETDPETDEQSVAIDVWSPMSCEEAVERKLRYTRQWVQSIPPNVIGMIRLIVSIA